MTHRVERLYDEQTKEEKQTMSKRIEEQTTEYIKANKRNEERTSDALSARDGGGPRDWRARHAMKSAKGSLSKALSKPQLAHVSGGRSASRSPLAAGDEKGEEEEDERALLAAAALRALSSRSDALNATLARPFRCSLRLHRRTWPFKWAARPGKSTSSAAGATAPLAALATALPPPAALGAAALGGARCARAALAA